MCFPVAMAKTPTHTHAHQHRRLERSITFPESVMLVLPPTPSQSLLPGRDGSGGAAVCDGRQQHVAEAARGRLRAVAQRPRAERGGHAQHGAAGQGHLHRC